MNLENAGAKEDNLGESDDIVRIESSFHTTSKHLLASAPIRHLASTVITICNTAATCRSWHGYLLYSATRMKSTSADTGGELPDAAVPLAQISVLAGKGPIYELKLTFVKPVSCGKL